MRLVHLPSLYWFTAHELIGVFVHSSTYGEWLPRGYGDALYLLKCLSMLTRHRRWMFDNIDGYP